MVRGSAGAGKRTARAASSRLATPSKHPTFPCMKTLALTLLLALSATSAQAVGLTALIRICGDDSKALCKGVSYGAPMQACLIRNKPKLTPACRAIVGRLEKGEKVRVFGGS